MLPRAWPYSAIDMQWYRLNWHTYFISLIQYLTAISYDKDKEDEEVIG